MQRYLLSLALGFCCVLVFKACKSDDISPNVTPNECSDEISFVSEVKPIISQNCAVPTCHNGDLGADRDWTNFQKVQQKATTIKSKVVSKEMPKAGSGITLSDEQIQTISCWVDQGAKDN